MSWSEDILEAYINIKHGFAFKGEHFSEEGEYIVLTPGNIQLEGGLKLTGKEKSYSDEFPQSFIFEAGDLVVVMTDLIQDAPILGGAFLIPESNKYLHNQRLGKVEIKGDVDKLFLYYYFNSEYYRGQVRGTATGATVRHTAPERIYQCKIKLPPPPIQRRIAEVMGRYNALIENYQRQVSILEASAQSLYREWFVHGRCPYARYENDANLPVGWECVRFTDVISIQSGGTPKTDNPQFWDGDIFWFSPADLENTFYILSTEKTISELGLKNCNSKLYPTNTVVITARGTVGRCVLLGRPMAINQSNYALIGKTVSQYFAFFKSLELADKWKQEATGAVFETITVNNFERTEIVIPTVEVLESFDKVIEPILNRIRNCLEQTELLKQMRNKLLLRLMSGQIPLTVTE